MEQVFAGAKSLKSTQLKELCMQITGCKSSTADTQRKEAVEAGIIGKNKLSEYVLLPKVTTHMKLLIPNTQNIPKRHPTWLPPNNAQIPKLLYVGAGCWVLGLSAWHRGRWEDPRGWRGG